MQLKKRLFTVLLSAVLMIGFVGVAMATEAAKEADTSWKFHDIVDVTFVQQHMTVPMPENVMIIDARPEKGKYNKGHIPMAVNIPDSKFDKLTDRLPKDKSALLIFYCQGPTCKLSHKSAWKAEKLGYTNVKVFEGGYPAWIKVAGNYPQIPASYVKKQMDADEAMVIVDSRPKRTMYDKGHVPGAISIPDSSFAKMTDQLPTDKGTELVFYCGGFKCRLSHKSAAKAIELGYTKVKVFSAGYPAWKEAYGGTDAAVVAGGANNKASALKAGKEEGSIDNDTFLSIIKEKPDSIYLIDVRDADEFATGTITPAVNIPVDKLEDEIKTLSAEKPIVFICGTGARSGEAFYMVQDLRPELKSVYYLEAELTIKKDGSFELKEPEA